MISGKEYLMKSLFTALFSLLTLVLTAEQIRYFADRTENYGVPQGCFEIPAEKAKNKLSYYQFFYDEKNRVTRIVYWQSGVPEKDAFNASILEFQYNAKGELQKRMFRSDTGEVVLSWIYPAGPDLILFADINARKQKPAELLPFDEYFSNRKVKSDLKDICDQGTIGGLRLERNQKGEVIRVRYLQNNDAAPGYTGSLTAGQEYELDELGRFTAVYFIDAEGKRKDDRNGVLGYRLQYQKDILAKTTVIGADGKPTRCRDGWAVSTQEQEGNDYTGRIHFRYFAEDGVTPVIDKQNNAAVNTIEYTDGLLRKYSNFGVDGKPCNNGEDFSVLHFTQYDSGNRILRIDCETISSSNEGNCNAIRIKYDKDGNMRERILGRNGKDGKFTLLIREEISYDAAGRREEKRLYDANGDMLVRGYNTYNANGWLIGEKKLHANGKITHKTYQRDPYGNLLHAVTEKGNVMYVRDSRGMTLRELQLDDSNTPVRGEEYTYDRSGRLLTVRFLRKDSEDKLQYVHEPDLKNLWMMREIKGKNGRTVRLEFCDEKGNIVECNGLAIHLYDYDDAGNQIRITRLNAKEEPAGTSFVPYIEEYSFDARGNVTGKCRFDTDMMLMPYPYYDCDEKDDPITLPGIFRAKFNNADEPLEVDLYAVDTPGFLSGIKGVYRINYSFRYENGCLLRSIKMFDEKDKRFQLSNGFAEIVLTFNQEGEQIGMSFLDINGKPVMHENGFSSQKLIDGVIHYYDAGGNEIPAPEKE